MVGILMPSFLAAFRIVSPSSTSTGRLFIVSFGILFLSFLILSDLFTFPEYNLRYCLLSAYHSHSASNVRLDAQLWLRCNTSRLLRNCSYDAQSISSASFRVSPKRHRHRDRKARLSFCPHARTHGSRP